MKVKTVLLAALLTAMPMSLSAGSVAGTGGATEVTQILNNTELVAQYNKMVQQYQAQLQSLTNHIQQTQMMVQNIQMLPAATWQRFTNDLLALKNIVQQGQAVSFAAANLDAQFANTYKGYSNYQTSAAQTLPNRTTTFAQQYQLLNTSTRDNVNGALKALNTQMNALTTDDSVMALLKAQSNSADGQLKVIQAANEIALHQTDTLKKLNYTLMTQASTQAQWISVQNEKETAQRALSEKMRSGVPVDPNRSPSGTRYQQYR